MENLTNWIQIAFTVLGGGYALFLFRQSNKDKRDKFILEIYCRLYGDEEIREIIYCVDSNRDTSEIKFQGKLERQADRTLKYFDYLGYLIKNGRLKKEDINGFRYEINRVMTNNDVVKYLKWLKNVNVKLEHLHYLNP